MKALLLACIFAVALLSGSFAAAQGYPAKAITVVVPFSAGGPTDTLARIMGERMRKCLGQPVLVDNTTGAGGSIGVAKVVRAPPDGYTVSIGHWGTHVVNGAYYNLSYNLLTDLEPVAMVASNPQVIISKPAVPAANLKELEYAEAIGLCDPGQAGELVERGEFDIGGRVAVSPSGGLIGRGHPGGATGLAQVIEIVTQLRGEAGDRQQPGARHGLAHMTGAGGVCVVHTFGR
jgi:hypothetical protein